MSETAAAPTGAESTGTTATNAGVNSPQSAQGGNTNQTAKGSAPSAPGQPSTPITKSELKELAEENLDAMVTVKVNGQTKKVSVRDALKLAELGDGAQAKMQAAAKERKEAQRLFNLAKTDPDKFFQETGIDPDKYAEDRLVKKYQRMAMTDEQRKAMETEEKLKQYEARDNQTRSGIISQIKNIAGELPEAYLKALEKATPEQLQGELQRAQALNQQHRQTIEKEFLDAWKDSGLPSHSTFGIELARLMHASQVQKNAGQREQALSAKEAAAIVKENFIRFISEITGQMDAERVHRLLGPKTMKKLRAFDVQRVTAKSAPHLEQPSGPERKPASQKSTKHVNESGWKQAWSKFG